MSESTVNVIPVDVVTDATPAHLHSAPPVEQPELLPSGGESSTTLIEESPFLHGIPLVLVLIGILLALFLVAIDQTIVANTLPQIASIFNALPASAWVPTAFLLTQAAFLLVFGQLSRVFPVKWVFIFAIAIFEIGSLFSGVATSMDFLIFGRAFSGVGAAGIYVAALALVAEVIPLKDRPKFFSSFGAVFAVSSVMGPLLGGAFVDHVSWRWCFYINLPLSVPTILFGIKFIKTRSVVSQIPVNVDKEGHPPSFMQRIRDLAMDGSRRLRQIDWIGVVLVLGLTTCLVLALEWGGDIKPWNSGAVIASFVVAGVLSIIFVIGQGYKGDKALVPFKMLNNRTVIGCSISAFFTRMIYFVAVYYLPLYFQAVKNHSALRAGVDILPLSLSVVITAAICGFIVSKTGRYWHVLFLCPMAGSVGFGLLYTLTPTTSSAKLIGYQILVGISVGATIQNTIIAVQATVSKKMVPQASALITFTQFVGGIIGIAIASTIFQNRLAAGLREFAPDAPFDLIRQSVTELQQLPADQHAGAVQAYVDALRLLLLVIGVPASALSSLSTFLVKNVNLKTQKEIVEVTGEDVEKGKA